MDDFVGMEMLIKFLLVEKVGVVIRLVLSVIDVRVEISFFI